MKKRKATSKTKSSRRSPAIQSKGARPLKPTRQPPDEEFVTIDLELDHVTKAALERIAVLARVSFDQVINVLFALKMLKDEELRTAEAYFED